MASGQGCYYCGGNIPIDQWPFYGTSKINFVILLSFSSTKKNSSFLFPLIHIDFYNMFEESGTLMIAGVQAIGATAVQNDSDSTTNYGLLVTASDCLPIFIETSQSPTASGSSQATL